MFFVLNIRFNGALLHHVHLNSFDVLQLKTTTRKTQNIMNHKEHIIAVVTRIEAHKTTRLTAKRKGKKQDSWYSKVGMA